MKKARAVLNRVYEELEAKAKNAKKSNDKRKKSRKTASKSGGPMEEVRLDRRELQRIMDQEFGKGKVSYCNDRDVLNNVIEIFTIRNQLSLC